MCQYCNLILPYIIDFNEAQQLQIQHFNAKKGGFGQIHYGAFKSQEVAIKTQSFKQDQKDEDFIYLLREIAIIAYCKHPNIAGIRAVYFHPQKMEVQIIQPRYYIDLNYVFGAKLSIQNKLFICYQILKALKYIHEVGLVHLDLKPSNIMFRDKSLAEIVLLDFGISNIYREHEYTKIQGMTVAYCPPEIRFHDLSKITPKADIFSFGIILYEFIMEKRAWEKYQNQPSSVIYNLIRNPEFSFFSENIETGKTKIDDLIINCVQRDLTQRPSAIKALEAIKLISF